MNSVEPGGIAASAEIMSPSEAMNTKPGNGRKTILVVDDEFGIRDFLYAYLKTKNFRVLTADCADEAFSVWESEKDSIDLVLSDIVMPGMNGHAMVEQLVTEKPEVKVIFMSGYMPVEIAEETLKHRFLRKPFKPHELLDAIREELMK